VIVWPWSEWFGSVGGLGVAGNRMGDLSLYARGYLEARDYQGVESCYFGARALIEVDR
jgi:hypothetical protein